MAILKKLDKVILLGLSFFALILTYIFLKDIKPNQFLFISDEYLSLSPFENFTALFTHIPSDFGTANTTILIVTFFDRLYYSLSYFLNINLHNAQIIFYFLKICLITLVPYVGFRKVATLYLKSYDLPAILFVSLWYSFNTYTLIYWHGNAFSVTLLLCYSLAPLCFYYFHNSLFDNKSIKYPILTCILLFLMSFAVYLFIVFIFLVAIYSLVYVYLSKANLFKFLKNVFILMLLYLPFLSIHILIPYELLTDSSPSINLSGGETFGNLQGGFLYQLFMWFSWGIYTYWQPRNIYTFYKYFFSFQSILAPFIIYAIVFYRLIKGKRTAPYLALLFVFLFFILFVKGSQPPFGNIYLFLVNHVYFFRLFRSPDNKFGFGIVLTLAILLLQASPYIKKKIFLGGVLLVIILQAWLVITGTAIVGQDTPTSSKRIITIPRDYKEAAHFLNSQSQLKKYGYFMILPPINFGNFLLEDNKQFIGQDLLPKITELSFVYFSPYSSMSKNTYAQISQAIYSRDVKKINELPLRYFIIRNDIRYEDVDQKLNRFLLTKFKTVFKNKTFTIIENPDARPIIESNNIQFQVINPVKYKILFKDIKGSQKITFSQSYNSNWEIYPSKSSQNLLCKNFYQYASGEQGCPQKNIFFQKEDLSFIGQKAFLDKLPATGDNYANTWLISSDMIKNRLEKSQYTVNPDGSVALEVTLFFKTQAVFYIGVIVTSIYLVTLISILFLARFKERKHGKKNN